MGITFGRFGYERPAGSGHLAGGLLVHDIRDRRAHDRQKTTARLHNGEFSRQGHTVTYRCF